MTDCHEYIGTYLSRKNFHLPVLFVFIFCTSAIVVSAQIQIKEGNNLDRDAAHLVRNFLLGNGIQIKSVKHIGSLKSIGSFEKAINELGIDKGLVLSTGSVSNIARPNDRKDTGDSPDPANTQTDTDLQNLTPYPVKEVTGLEIQFVAQTADLEFRYVFASEEYPEFTCSKFNDIFAFFISGPNPDGGVYNKKNIALVPDPNDPSGNSFTDFPVWTNTVNNGKVGEITTDGSCTDKNESLAFTQYYNDNSNSLYLTFDGYLDVFKARVRIVPCQVYTIKLIIGDSNDFDYDSAVFLEANSLKSRDFFYALEGMPDNTIVEGCQSGRIAVVYDKPVTEDINHKLNIVAVREDDALVGLDYELSDTEFRLRRGDSIAYIEFHPLEDNMAEAPEFIRILDAYNGCIIDTLSLRIADNRTLELSEQFENMAICPGGSTLSELFPEIIPQFIDFTSGTGDYQFGNRSPSLLAIPILVGQEYHNITYSGLSDICLDAFTHTNISEVSILLKSPDGEVVRIKDTGGDKISFVNEKLCLSQIVDFNSINSFLSKGDHAISGRWEFIIIDEVSNNATGSFDKLTIFFENPGYKHITFTDTFGKTMLSDALITQDSVIEVVVSDRYNCMVSKRIKLSIIESINEPINISCGTSDRDQLGFSWQMTGDERYEIDYGNGWTDIGQTDRYIISGLPPDTTVTLRIRTNLGACSGPVSEVTCVSPPCIDPDIIISNKTDSDDACMPNGSFEINTTNTKGPYRYFLDSKEILDSNVSGLARGRYAVSVIDAYGCPNSTNVSIAGVASMQLSATVEGAYCGQQGFIDLFVSDGVFPYTYMWSNGSTEKDINGLDGGEYTVTVTDADGCHVSKSFIIEQTQRMKIMKLDIENVSCAGLSDGYVRPILMGGHTPYQYEIVNITSGVVHDTFGLPAGNYSITVTDRNQCLTVSEFSINEPDTLTLEAYVDGPSCDNDLEAGAIELNVSGGHEPYIYTWSDNSSEEGRVALVPGVYMVTISDNENCTISDSFTINTPVDPAVEVYSYDASCYGATDGNASISIANESFSVLWDNGQNTPLIDNLSSGRYCAMITTESGCIIDTCINISQPADMTVETIITDNSCFGVDDAGIDLTVSSGKGPFTFLVSDNIYQRDSILIQRELSPGLYGVRVIDSQGCSKDVEIEINPAPVITTVISKRDVACYSGSDGSIALDLSGSSEIDLISWIGPDGYTSQSAEINDLIAGVYAFQAVDNKGCQYSNEITVTEPAEPTLIDITVEDVTCFGMENGSIMATLAEGVSEDFEYSLNNGFLSNNTGLFESLSPGEYDLLTIDENGCEVEIPGIVVVEPFKFLIDIEVDTEVIESQNIPIEVKVSNAQGNYKLNWASDPAKDLPCTDCQSTVIIDLKRHLFISVEAIDDKGCIAYDEKKIYVRRANHISVPTAFTPNRDGRHDALYVYGTNGTRILDFTIYSSNGSAYYSASDFVVNNEDVGWDGTYGGRELSPGSYTWTATALFKDGFKKKFSGTTQLIR